ncbi:MAG: leucine-rich repeat domain-containing protein [Lachnospiraceae bacterium]|nr:leucine-rich repeat domain-containing protein [Lachnospiraceae bacterium]
MDLAEFERKLNPAQPIPADTGTVAVSPQTFDDLYLTLNLPTDVTTSVENITSVGKDGVIVTDNQGEWTITFCPMDGNNSNLIHNLNNTTKTGPNAKVDWDQDVPGKLAGFDVRVWAYNLSGATNTSDVREAVDIVLDYGGLDSGSFYGLYISLAAIERKEGTNIYDILKEPRVLAILNNFEVIKTPDKISYTVAGTTVSMPGRWNVIEDSLLASYYIDEIWHSFNIINSPSKDIMDIASTYADEVNTYEYGSRTFYGGIRTLKDTDDSGNEKITGYSLSLFTEFNEERVLWITVSMPGGTSKEDVLANLEEPELVSVLSSIEVDPNGYTAPGQAISDGFVVDKGVLVEYRGTDTEVVIPSEVGGELVTAIDSTGNLFRNNKDITSVEMPDTITQLSYGCFYECENLETVVFSSALTEIPGTAFYGCSSLKDVVLGENIVSVGEDAFEDAGTGTFTALGPAVFETDALRGSGFTSLTFADGCDLSAESIMYAAKASEVNLPSDLEVLGTRCMMGMESLERLQLPDSVTTLEDQCLYGVKLTRLNVPLNLETVGEEICNSWYIEELTISDGVTTIPANFLSEAFVYFVNIPASVTYIGENAIEGAYVVLNSKDITMEENALDCYDLYLNGMYSTDEIPEDIAKQSVSSQCDLPMDASVDEMNALDDWLEEHGADRIAYYGIAPEFFDVDRMDYIAYADDRRFMESYVGDKTVVHIPYCGSSDYGTLIWLREGAFSNTSGITELSLGILNSFQSGSFQGLSDLQDLWLNGIQIEFALQDPEGSLSADSFTGINENVTIHYPDWLSGDELTQLKETYEASGMPSSAVYEPYSLRG